jgi:hypothetical protein
LSETDIATLTQLAERQAEQAEAKVHRFTDPREKNFYQEIATRLTTFAYIKDGQWVGRAKMGWFALDYDANMTVGEWRSHYLKMVQDLDDDTTLTVVDCHI